MGNIDFFANKTKEEKNIDFFANKAGGTNNATLSPSGQSAPVSKATPKTDSNVIYTSKNGSTVTQSDLDKWVDPSYKLTKSEKKLAKETKKANFNYKTLDSLSYDDQLKYTQLDNKLRGVGVAFGSGFIKGTVPLADTLEKGIAKLTLGDEADTLLNQLDYQDELSNKHFVSSGAGRLLGSMANYSNFKQIPAVGKVADKIGGALGGGKIAKGVGNIAADTLIDLTLDTTPEAVNNIVNGKSGSEVAKDIAKNIGTNVAFNIGGEVLPYAVKGIKNGITNKKTAKLVEDIAEATKKTDEVVDAVKNTDNVAKVADEVTPKVKAEPEVKAEVKPEVKTEVKPTYEVPNNLKKDISEYVDTGYTVAPKYNKPLDPKTVFVPKDAELDDVIGVYVNPKDGKTWEYVYFGKNDVRLMPKVEADSVAKFESGLREDLGDETTDALLSLFDEPKKKWYSEDIPTLNPNSTLDEVKNVDVKTKIENPVETVKTKTENPIPEVVRTPDGMEVEAPMFTNIMDNLPNNGEPIPMNFADEVWGGANPGAKTEMPKVEIGKAEAPKELPAVYSGTENIPRNNFDGDVGISKTYKDGTIVNNNLGDLNNPTDKFIAEYQKHHNSETLANAQRDYERDGARIMDDFVSGKRTISDDTAVDTAMIGANAEAEQVRQLRAEGKEADASFLEAKLNILKLRIRQAATSTAQKLQAFAKWNGTSQGAVINAERLLDERGKTWTKKNAKKAGVIDEATAKLIDAMNPPKEKLPTNSDLQKALDGLVDKNTFKRAEGTAKTHADYLKEVKGTFEKELSSFDTNFTDTDYEVLATFLENKVSAEEISDELAHRLKYGTWYTLDESIEEIAQPNGKVNSAIRNMLGEDIPKDATELSKAELRKQIKASFDGELASVFDDINDDDVEYVANLIENGIKNDELADLLKTRAGTGKWNIDQSVVEEVNNIFKEAELKDIDSKERVELENKAFSLLADNVYGRGGTGWEKFDQWRYLAMLGNLKTHGRNIISNGIFSAVHGTSNNMAAVMESLADKANKLGGGNGIERTKSLINPIKDKPLVETALKDSELSSYRQLTGGKYSTDLKRSIESQRKVFKSNLMNTLSEGNTKALEAEDIWFNKRKYATSLAGYLKANGFDESVFNAERRLAELKGRDIPDLRVQDEIEELQKQVEVLNKGREYAIEQAQYSTFHEDNIIAEAITRAQRNMRQSDSTGVKALGKITEGIMPFAKTPMNILRSGIEYSPLGLIRDAIDVKELAKGNMTGAKFIENLSKTLTGSSLFLLGWSAYNHGLLSTSEDGVTGNFDSNQGKQAYALNIGDKTLTIDFAVPSAMPLLVGAEVAKTLGNDGFEVTDFNALIDALSSIAEPINETSMLSGVNDTIESIKNSDNVLGTLAFNSLTGYFSQALPTVMGQFARTIDNTRRSTYAENEGAVGAVEKQLNKAVNKIPFASMTNEPYVDLWGREQKNGPDGIIPRLAYQTLSPSYVSDVNTTRVDEEIQRLFDTMDDNASVLPKPHAYKIGDERMSQKDRYTYSKVNGETRYDLLETLFETDIYKNATDEEKSKYISEMYTLASKSAKYSVTGDDSEETNKLYGVYKSDGINGVMNYLTTKDALEDAGYSMSNSKAVEVYEKYGDYGLSVMSNIKSLGTTKKDVLTEYLDNTNLSTAEKEYWFGLFNSGANPYDSTNIPTLAPTTITKKNFNR